MACDPRRRLGGTGENPIANQGGTPEPIPEARFASTEPGLILGGRPKEKGEESWNQSLEAGVKIPERPPVLAKSSACAHSRRAEESLPKTRAGGKEVAERGCCWRGGPPAPVRPSLRSAHFSSARDKAVPFSGLPSQASLRKEGGIAGKDGVFGGAESPARVGAVLEICTSKGPKGRTRETYKQTFFFDLQAQPGS